MKASARAWAPIQSGSDYVQVASFRKIEREEISGTVPTTTGTSARDEFVAIECLR